jgi:ABC-type phosphate transport system substrate-binding protein
MLKVTKMLPLLLAMLFSTSWLGAVPAAVPQGEDVAIIVNKSNPIDNLSLADLRKLFLAEQTHWSNGHKVTLVMLQPGQLEREPVLRLIYHMTESSLDRYFLHGQYTGEIQSMPKVLATPAGACKFVFNVPGAIGYVRVSEVEGSVKVVKVDGHMPGESGYPLKVGRQ